MKYDCIVNMPFWAMPDSLNGWGIEVTVQDQNLQTGINTTKTFNVDTTSLGDPNINSLAWGSISFTAIGAYANPPVVIENEGNTPLDIDVTAYDVRGADYVSPGDKEIPAERFRVDTTGSGCGGNIFTTDGDIQDVGTDIPRGAISIGNLEACITNMAGLELTAQTYTSHTPWSIDMS